ncbi:MAG: copper resistance protein CopC [Actinomycetota bacterium]|nr:copper resistance protein CopC [Actinomycetota bacterium]
MFRTTSVGLAAFLVVLAVAGPAAAHGEKVKTDPSEGTGVKTVPGRVSVTLSEAPTPQAKLQLTDGCGRQVARSVAVRGEDIVASVSDAQPGRWKASYRAISSVDGHESEGSWTFRVAGQKDCSEDETSGDDDPGDNDAIEPGTEATGDTAPAADASSFPVVPVAIGAAILLLAAFLVRRSTA